MDLKKYILLVFIGLMLFLVLSFFAATRDSSAGSVVSAWAGELTWIKDYNPQPGELLLSMIATFLPALLIAALSVRYFESSQHDAMTAAYAYGIANAALGALFFIFVVAASFKNVDYFSLGLLLPLALVSVIKFLGSLLCGVLATALVRPPVKSKHRRAYQD